MNINGNKSWYKTFVIFFFSGYLVCTAYMLLWKLSEKYSTPTGSENRFYDVILNRVPIVSNKRTEKVTGGLVEETAFDYPFNIENNYELLPDAELDFTLVSYYDVNDGRYLKDLMNRWRGAMNIVVYYKSTEIKELDNFKEICSTFARARCIPYILTSSIVPINKLKNIGIAAVITTHYIFVEFNLSPTTNLYNDLLMTPGYLWRDPSFVGVIPVYEYADDSYAKQNDAYQKFDKSINGPNNMKQCLKNYECRPMQTTTIPMQFRWFSFMNYRSMNCIDNNTEIYMVLQKSNSLPRYDETITQRGYDNIEYVDKIRYSNMKLGQLSNNFFFRISGIGVDSNVIVESWNDHHLLQQYESSKREFIKTLHNNHPIVNCESIEPAMRSWVNFQKYSWIKEGTTNNKLYPRIAVAGENAVLEL